ncbi:hypothetical protein [Sphaerisporangium flaviroseum]
MMRDSEIQMNAAEQTAPGRFTGAVSEFTSRSPEFHTRHGLA